jgi:hypothetical protein
VAAKALRFDMKRDMAEGISTALKHVEQALGELDVAVRSVESESERKRMIRAVLSVVHDLHLHITLAVAREHPDLHPDGYSRTW